MFCVLLCRKKGRHSLKKKNHQYVHFWELNFARTRVIIRVIIHEERQMLIKKKSTLRLCMTDFWQDDKLAVLLWHVQSNPLTANRWKNSSHFHLVLRDALKWELAKTLPFVMCHLHQYLRMFWTGSYLPRCCIIPAFKNTLSQAKVVIWHTDFYFYFPILARYRISDLQQLWLLWGFMMCQTFWATCWDSRRACSASRCFFKKIFCGAMLLWDIFNAVWPNGVKKKKTFPWKVNLGLG